ncbi:hypothetical protein H0H93_002370 [Arthromyces matolae]|nr:hypothetical protein H0H93_002370 [Arthromyces matolae]
MLSSPSRPRGQLIQRQPQSAPPPSRLLVPATRPPDPSHCLGIHLRFHVVEENIQVNGYQMYAVEKWFEPIIRASSPHLTFNRIVERKRPVTVLLVPVFALSPLPELSPIETKSEWDKALNHLRRDGARPKETPQGVLMATSLAHFRSDYTIVLIPDGNFLLVREQLYTNINLLRMGASGRSALTLEDPRLRLTVPSDTTKSRFVSTYLLPDSLCSNAGPIATAENVPFSALTKTRSHSHSRSSSVLNFTKYSPENPTTPPNSLSKAKAAIGLGLPSTLSADIKSSTSKEKQKSNNTVFTATVLELVKLIQAGLSLFGMFGVIPRTNIICPKLDGLLCDETVDGIRRWIVEVGEPCLGLEPMERIADPMFVSALLSLVICVRNKLAAISFSNILPKDPFLQPHLFISALNSYVQSTAPASSSPQPSYHEPHSLPSQLSNGAPSAFTQTHSHSHSLSSGLGGTMFTPTLLHLFPSHTSSPHQITPANSSSSGSSNTAAATTSTTPTALPIVLTRELIDTISLSYDTKIGATDGRVGGGRVRRALRDKLRAGIDSDGEPYATPGINNVAVSGVDRGTTSGGEGVGGGSGIGIVDHREGREKDLLGGVGTGVGSSGGQILSGIGSFASGLGLSVGAGTGGATGAGAVLDATYDLDRFLRCLYSKDGKGKGRAVMGTRRDKKGDRGDLLSAGLGYVHAPQKEKDGGVGLSVRALWSGQVNSIIKLREWEVEKERMGATGLADGRKRKMGKERDREKERDRLALSDGDVDDSVIGIGSATLARSETEEESDAAMQHSFKGMWGGRMQRKLGSWTGLHKRRPNASLDLTTAASRGESGLSISTQADALATARPDMTRGQSMPLSPLLPPTGFSGGEGEPDDDDLLSSGQVSPIDNLPFSLLQDGLSLENTSLATSDYDRKVSEFHQKRAWNHRIPQNRISSWADPLSGAREFLDDENSDFDRSSRSRRGRRVDTMGSLLGGDASVLSDVMSEALEDLDEFESSREFEGPLRRKMPVGSTRRRSFHDFDTVRGLHVLPVEHMRVDVELAGQLLIMSRRDEHLRNVIACLQVITSTLSSTNSQLREDYTSHASFISELDTHAQVISSIDAENAKADKTSQATNTLRYEAEQFRIPDLWHTAMPSRQKVFALREKVFGTGGRRLPAGVHGAYGKYNRLQWTLDGRERLVDHLGRTESEAEEEESGVPYLGLAEEDKDEEVVQHPSIKPMWLLHFFTSWGARWGASAAAQTHEDGSTKATPQSTSGVHQHGKLDGNGQASNGANLTKRKKNSRSAVDLLHTGDEAAPSVSS